MKIRRRKAFVEFAARACYELHRSLCLVLDKGDRLGAMALSWEELPEAARENQRQMVDDRLLRGPEADPAGPSLPGLAFTNLDRVKHTLVFQLLLAWQAGPRRKAAPE